MNVGEGGRCGRAMDEATVFCERLRPGLIGALSLHVGDAGVAEELAQETLVRVWSRWTHVRRLDVPEAWAHRVASNLANSWWRRRVAEQRARRRHGPTPVDEPRPQGDHGDAMAVRAAVAALPRRQREALVLRYFAGFSVAETAEAMGRAPGTVKALCHQGIARLRAAGIHHEDADATVGREVTGDG